MSNKKNLVDIIGDKFGKKVEKYDLKSYKTEMNAKKFNIILDLDNTLINSLTPTEVKKMARSKFRKFESVDMDKSYKVFLRPGLQDFLDFLFENFNVSVWTAASKEYASFIIDEIILNRAKYGDKRKLDVILFSYHCDFASKYKKCIKSPVMLWEIFRMYHPSKTYLIDDLPEIHKKYPQHVIKADYFDVTKSGSENDDFLYRIKDKLGKLLDIVPYFE